MNTKPAEKPVSSEILFLKQVLGQLQKGDSLSVKRAADAISQRIRVRAGSGL